MDAVDPFALSRTLGRLLRGRQTDLRAQDGWFAIHDVAAAASAALGLAVTVSSVERVAARAGLERDGDRVRPLPREGGARPPDVLWVLLPGPASDEPVLAGGGGLALFLDEASAWLAGHGTGPTPVVYAVDVLRCRKLGARFERHVRTGAWTGFALPLAGVLDLQPGFAVQVSAGGMPIRWTAGRPDLGLIRVERRRGSTWEVAKGKLEDGEPPEAAAVREVREEMGLPSDPTLVAPLGTVHYGFLAPGGLPRLKVVHLFLMETTDDETQPARAEGISDVRWFAPDEAVRAVTHPSLTGAMRRARTLVARRAPPR